MKISVIIPTLNNYTLLEKTLISLCSQKEVSPNDFEILVCDNRSTDRTKDVVAQVCLDYPLINIKYFYEPVPGSMSARHRGFKESATDNILVFTDDDVLFSSIWLKTIIIFFEKNNDAHLLGGPSKPLFETQPPHWLDYFIYKNKEMEHCGNLSLLNIFTDVPIEVNPNLIWSLNMAIRKDTFIKCGGLHHCVISKEYQHFQGDGETGLTMKLKELGYAAYFHPEVLVRHTIPKSRLTFNYFDNRYFYQGVCNSYTDFRKKYGLYNKVSDDLSLYRKARNFAGNLKRKILKVDCPEDKYEELLIKQRFHQCYLAGYNFHQWAVKNNKELLKWVLKENYFDYKLPDITGDFKADKSCY